jgi:hypothetical protein
VERGVVTGTNMFGRSIGSAIGVALFGAIANASLGSAAHTAPTLARASHDVFLAVFVVAVLMGLAVAFMPRVVTEQRAPGSPGPPVDEPVPSTGTV